MLWRKVINLEISKGMYCYDKSNRKAGIGNVVEFLSNNNIVIRYNNNINVVSKGNVVASFNLIDLIEYMDLLEIENSVKLYGENKTVALFNPVRCDGFTEFEDGTHCIILNLDYLVDVKDLKIKSVLTREQFDACKYVVERK